MNDEYVRRGERAIQSYPESAIGHLFTGAERAVLLLREALPDLFGDFPAIPVSPTVEIAPAASGTETPNHYSRRQLQGLVTLVEQILEVLANSELSAPQPSAKTARRVFISHGRASDWREVQAYIEKDIGLSTLELAQEANQGRTIMAKLADSASSCDSAVIVMTADDLDAEGQARARENVIHEIGISKASMDLTGWCCCTMRV